MSTVLTSRDVARLAIEQLRLSVEHANPTASFDPVRPDYLAHAADNLIGGLTLDRVARELGAGSGGELVDPSSDVARQPQVTVSVARAFDARVERGTAVRSRYAAGRRRAARYRAVGDGNGSAFYPRVRRPGGHDEKRRDRRGTDTSIEPRVDKRA